MGVGMPFTDPMADGPAIQVSSQRALKAGQNMRKTLAMIRSFRTVDDTTPIVLMGYYNPIYVYGVDKFLVDAKEAGIDGLIVVDFPYFAVPGGTAFVERTTYVDHEGELESPDLISFNHGIGEIITAVMDAGLTLLSFEEHRSVQWNPLADEFVEIELEEFELRDRPERLAASYTLQAVKGAPATLTP